jgi:NAD(P)-dependent dehydrogenase (short-subunit alcohol dehydrogenase family)
MLHIKHRASQYYNPNPTLRKKIPAQNTLLLTTPTGIGLAIAHHLLSSTTQHKLLLISRTAPVLSALQQQYGTSRVAVLAGDMSDASLPAKAVDLCLQKFSRIDSLIINHGSLDPVKKVSESSAEEWSKAFDINVFSAVGLVCPLPPVHLFYSEVQQILSYKWSVDMLKGTHASTSHTANTSIPQPPQS